MLRSEFFRLKLSAAIAGESQRHFAERAGISYVFLNRILKGHSNPTLETCDKIADALGFKLEELLADPPDFLRKKTIRSSQTATSSGTRKPALPA